MAQAVAAKLGTLGIVTHAFTAVSAVSAVFAGVVEAVTPGASTGRDAIELSTAALITAIGTQLGPHLANFFRLWFEDIKDRRDSARKEREAQAASDERERERKTANHDLADRLNGAMLHVQILERERADDRRDFEARIADLQMSLARVHGKVIDVTDAIAATDRKIEQVAEIASGDNLPALPRDPESALDDDTPPHGTPVPEAFR